MIPTVCVDVFNVASASRHFGQTHRNPVKMPLFVVKIGKQSEKLGIRQKGNRALTGIAR